MNAEHLARLLVTAACACAVASCYSPAKTLSPGMAEAFTFNEQAESAFNAGDHATAQRGYKAALDLHIAANDSPGIIRNLINLAVVQHTAGLNSAAIQSLAALDRHLATRDARLDSESRQLIAEAAWLKAHICLDEGRLDQAQAELDRAEARFGRSGTPRLPNVRARLLLAQKRPAEAAEAAHQAWKAARHSGDAGEQADAARYQARAMEQTGQHAKAAEWYRAALPLDQSLSRHHLVAEDLLGQARAEQKLGHQEAARNTALLALDASKRSADRAQQSAAQNLLRSLTR